MMKAKLSKLFGGKVRGPYAGIMSPSDLNRTVQITKRDGTVIKVKVRNYSTSSPRITVRDIFHAQEVRLCDENIVLDMGKFSDVCSALACGVMPTGPWMQDLLKAICEENVLTTEEVFNDILDAAESEERKPRGVFEDYFLQTV